MKFGELDYEILGYLWEAIVGQKLCDNSDTGPSQETTTCLNYLILNELVVYKTTKHLL